MQTPQIHSFPDSLLPNHWSEIRKELLKIRDGIELGGLESCCARGSKIVIRIIVQLRRTYRACFRDHLVIKYEIAKYEGDLGQPDLYVALSDKQAQQGQPIDEVLPQPALPHVVEAGQCAGPDAIAWNGSER